MKSVVYNRGDWAAVCDVCGFKFKASVLRRRWDGLMVCPADWNPRQPQDFAHDIPNIQSPDWTRPEPGDTFVAINYTEYPSDIISFLEVIAKSFTGPSLADSISITDSDTIVMNEILSDSISISDSSSITIATATAINSASINNTAIG